MKGPLSRAGAAADARFPCLAGWVCAGLGGWRRRRGRYDRLTLALLRVSWKARCRPLALLILYHRFRRDLGYRVPARWAEAMASHHQRLKPPTRRLVVNWLSESRGPAALAAFSTLQLAPLAELSPPIAAELARRGVSLSRGARLLAQMHSAQEAWTEGFARHLRRHRGSICIVGNAATLEGRGTGRAIDAHEVVFRFNRFSTQRADAADGNGSVRPEHSDTGDKLQVWVCAPDLPPPYPARIEAARWIVLSGPDAQYHLADWRHTAPLLQAGHRVLTVPLDVWRRLVRELQAPPSAGILCLAWVMALNGGAEGLTAAGFQRRPVSRGRYHLALPRHRPSRRHNWAAERRLLRQWEAQGLRFLD